MKPERFLSLKALYACVDRCCVNKSLNEMSPSIYSGHVFSENLDLNHLVYMDLFYNLFMIFFKHHCGKSFQWRDRYLKFVIWQLSDV